MLEIFMVTENDEAKKGGGGISIRRGGEDVKKEVGEHYSLKRDDRKQWTITYSLGGGAASDLL